jgi:proline racemase
VREPVTNEELGEWAIRADDAGHLARELVAARALIFQLAHQVERLQHFEQVHISNLDMYRTQLGKQDALIRELVAALDQVKDRARLPGTATRDEINALLAKAKAAGFDP